MRKGIVCLLVVVCAIAAFAQGNTSVLNGTVLDPSGAVIVGAEIAATKSDTSIVRTAKTNSQGDFTIAGLDPGEYTLSVKSRGFKELKQKVQVAVGRSTDLKSTLTVSGGDQVIDQIDTVPLVATSESSVDQVISSQQIERLPLNGRNYLELAFLVPGNAPAPNFDPTKTTTVLVSSAGQIGRGGSVTVDGADNNDDVVGGSLHNLPQDAVQEFQIATNRYSAELGRSGSSVINVVTKSGSNQYHGAVSFFERDAALQGLPATYDRTQKSPGFDRQQYAGSLGGPIVRDKAWWFSGFEYRDQSGAVLVGRRDTATQTIAKDLVTSPLNDLLWTSRADWKPADADQLTLRFSLQRSEETGQSTLIRSLGSASQRQTSKNNIYGLSTSWTRTFTPSLLNRASFAWNNFENRTNPLQQSPQYTFPSLQDGSSFRVPQGTTQNRVQFSDTLDWIVGPHSLKFGADIQRIDADFDLDVFRQGRVELVEDFAPMDRNGDGIVNDNDLLFAVTLRSGKPNQGLTIPNADNWYTGFFVQDDWKLHPQFVLNLGLRYELDSNVKNISGVKDLNPLILPFLKGTRGKDTNNWGPRVGFNWSTRSGNLSVHGGYGIYYDRITLEVASLERGLDGRALPIEVRGGNVFFMTPLGTFAPGAPTLANPFTGPVFPGAGAGGINIIDNRMQNPSVQQFNLGVQAEVARDFVVRADGVHNLGTHFIIGRTIGSVINPVVGGPDLVKNLESSVNTKYDALLLSAQKRYAERFQFMASYTLSKSFNYANDDQIPFNNGPIDSNDLPREYGYSPVDQRHRFVFSGSMDLPWRLRFSPIWTIASGVPMDILLPDASSRVPEFRRNSGGRAFHSIADLNAAITAANANRAPGDQLPLAPAGARFNDSFQSFDFRLSKMIKITERADLELIGEAFNIFNVTNIIGVSNQNYSGFNNVLGPNFGKPVTTAGGVFGSGGPRAFQLGARFSF